jgi:NAD(P)-dependent dehydrogenase (short-subunit alcohol dehydrogenase family)
LDVNQHTAVQLTQACVPAMREVDWGRVVVLTAPSLRTRIHPAVAQQQFGQSMHYRVQQEPSVPPGVKPPPVLVAALGPALSS